MNESLPDQVQIEIPDLGEPPKAFPAQLAQGDAAEANSSSEREMENMESPVERAASIAVIPDRVYFRIGDVAEITGIKPYVLRFWEKEFDLISPVKNNSGQRVYRRSDVEAVLLIKRLLYTERFSIEGAKKRIRELRRQRELGSEKRKRGELDDQKLKALVTVRKGLLEIIELCRPTN